MFSGCGYITCYSQLRRSYLDFGDGTVLTTQDSIAVHTYVLPIVYTCSYTDSTGCQLSYVSTIRFLWYFVCSPQAAGYLCVRGTISYGPNVVSYVADTLGYPLSIIGTLERVERRIRQTC